MDYVIVLKTGAGVQVKFDGENLKSYIENCRADSSLCSFNDEGFLINPHHIMMAIRQENTTRSNIVVPQTNTSIDISKLR